MNPVTRGAEIELTVEKFADRGKGLARVGEAGFVVFVEGGVPGDRVRAQVRKKKGAWAEARVLEVLEASPLRTEPRCEYFATCGGCKWQHVTYEAQKEMKRQAVADALRHTGGFDLDALGVEVRPTIGGDPEALDGGAYFYRNKMEFSFSARRWLTDDEIATGAAFDRDFALGLHAPGRFDAVLDIHACYLQSEWSVRAVNRIRAFAQANGWTPWDTRQFKGFLRHLVIRTPAHTEERMLNLVTSNYDEEKMAAFSTFIRNELPETTTLVNTVNSGTGQTALGDQMVTLFGPGVVHDRLGPHLYEINTRGAERLYAVAAEFAGFRPEDLVYDLYCGAGTISLHVADRVRHVVGVELVEEAVANARVNMVENGVDNCSFIAGDMLKVLTPEFFDEHGRPDVVIVDPPRAGLHPRVAERLAEVRPERLVYVSCNPQTQARDLDLMRHAFEITAVQPVDLFPQTAHVENVVALRAV
jgi:23S rRNA (uracil1939-C5)-methyltransferase